MTRETLEAAKAFVAKNQEAAREASSRSPSGDASLWLGPDERFFFADDHHNHARLASFIGLVDPLTGQLVATRF